MRVERRFMKGAEVRATEAPATKAPQIEGYAAVFNQWFTMYEDDDFVIRETIAPGAFTEVLGSSDVRCLFNHRADHVLGRTTNDTLQLAQDDAGLKYTNLMDPDTHIGRDVYQFVKRGDVTGCSFAFTVGDDEAHQTWAEREDEQGRTIIERTIVKVSGLYDVGPVTYPAYEQTSVSVHELAPAAEKAVALRCADWSDDLPEEIRQRILAGKEKKPKFDVELARRRTRNIQIDASL